MFRISAAARSNLFKIMLSSNRSTANTQRATRLFIATLMPTLTRLNAVCVSIETRGGYSKTEMLEGVRAFRQGDEAHPIAKQIYAALCGANPL